MVYENKTPVEKASIMIELIRKLETQIPQPLEIDVKITFNHLQLIALMLKTDAEETKNVQPAAPASGIATPATIPPMTLLPLVMYPSLQAYPDESYLGDNQRSPYYRSRKGSRRPNFNYY